MWTEEDNERYHIVDSATEADDKEATGEDIASNHHRPPAVSDVPVWGIPAANWGRARTDYDITHVDRVGTSNNVWQGMRFPWIHEENGNVNLSNVNMR